MLLNNTNPEPHKLLDATMKRMHQYNSDISDIRPIDLNGLIQEFKECSKGCRYSKFLSTRTNFVKSVLSKLQDDKYIHKPNDENYQLTFEGSLFISEGGYTTRLRKETSKERLTNWGIVLGTVATAIGLLYSIGKIADLLREKAVPVIYIGTAFFLFGAGILTGLCIILVTKEVLNQIKHK